MNHFVFGDFKWPNVAEYLSQNKFKIRIERKMFEFNPNSYFYLLIFPFGKLFLITFSDSTVVLELVRPGKESIVKCNCFMLGLFLNCRLELKSESIQTKAIKKYSELK